MVSVKCVQIGKLSTIENMLILTNSHSGTWLLGTTKQHLLFLWARLVNLCITLQSLFLSFGEFAAKTPPPFNTYQPGTNFEIFIVQKKMPQSLNRISIRQVKIFVKLKMRLRVSTHFSGTMCSVYIRSFYGRNSPHAYVWEPKFASFYRSLTM